MPKPVPPTFTDYAVTAVSPALIMAMIGSMVFFLVEVLYDGKYAGRLLYTLSCFIFGAVLIARIAIRDGAKRALLYGAGLGAAVYLALGAFVEYPDGSAKKLAPIFNLMLMALIWWAANKLTWDCTHIDEDRKHAGRGVLDAAANDEPEELPKPKKNATWIERWEEHRKQQLKKAHTPGVWVLYFSLAALPIFGLGQSLIPREPEFRRYYVFVLGMIYVGSGLGLLATTTLLGLRKYLRDRGASIPAKMTGGWLGLAAIFVAVFLVIAAYLPRPYSETPIVKIGKIGAKDRKADKTAPVKDGGDGTGEGDGGRKQKDDKNAEASRDGEKGAGKKQDGEQGGGQRGDEEKRGEGEHSDQDAESEQARDREGDGSRSSSKALEAVGKFLKWLAWILIALIVIAAIIIFVLYYLSPFTDWARRLLDRLRGLVKHKPKRESIVEIVTMEGAEKPRPFSSFEDPIGNGVTMSLPELVTYSFEAFEAWAWERGLAKRADETPLEFAKRIERETGLDGRGLANLLGQLQYSTSPLKKNDAGIVRAFWSAEPLQSARGARPLQL